MDNIAIVTGGGIGDCILAYQAASYVQKHSDNFPYIFLCARKEVVEPLNHIFRTKLWPTFWINEEKHWDIDNLIKDQTFLENLRKDYKEVYVVLPDVLFTGKYAFDWKKYRVNLKTLTQTRLLTHFWKPKKQIYCALSTSTGGYSYSETHLLLKYLDDILPKEYIVRRPILKKWAGMELYPTSTTINYSSRIQLIESPDIKTEIDELRQSEYCVCLDNGPSHLAYQFGIPRLLLDPRMGQFPWVARWREDVSESIVITTPSKMIANLVKINIEIPQTQLLPKQFILNNMNSDWKTQLLLKYE